VLHEDRLVLEPGQPRFMTWLAAIGLTRNEAKSRLSHPLEGAQPGGEFVGFNIRPYRVGTHHSGQRSTGQRLGCTTRMKPAKANLQEHRAESGRIRQRGKVLSQGALLPQLNLHLRGGANDDRTGVSQAVDGRRDFLPGEKLRSWAHRRPPTTSAAGVRQRYWHQLDTRLVFATSATAPDTAHLQTHRGVPMTRHVKVQGHRRPSEGDGVYWRPRQGRDPKATLRLAKRLQQPRGCCPHWGVFFPHDDRIEVEHRSGDRRDSRDANRQGLHGHGHDANTRAQGDDLPRRRRDTHQHTEERREAKVSCSDLDQR